LPAKTGLFANTTQQLITTIGYLFKKPFINRIYSPLLVIIFEISQHLSIITKYGD